jgi:hypothetical protein
MRVAMIRVRPTEERCDTRHFLPKTRPNRCNLRAANNLRATSRATKPGRRDMDREAVSYQLSAVSRESPEPEDG